MRDISYSVKYMSYRVLLSTITEYHGKDGDNKNIMVRIDRYLFSSQYNSTYDVMCIISCTRRTLSLRNVTSCQQKCIGDDRNDKFAFQRIGASARNNYNR